VDFVVWSIDWDLILAEEPDRNFERARVIVLRSGAASRTRLAGEPTFSSQGVWCLGYLGT
jgi:hypothetical protein